MAGEDYTSDGSVYHDTLNLVKDGEVYNFESIQKSATPKRGLFAKLLDNVQHVKNIAVAGLPLAGGNVSGAIILDTPGARLSLRVPVQLTNADQTLGFTHNVYRVPAITAARTYTVPTPLEEGHVITIVKVNNANFDVVIQRADGGGTLCTFVAATNVFSSVTLIARGGPVWSVMDWAGGALPTHDP